MPAAFAEQDSTDEVLGIVRCVKCGHRLHGEIECPFCSAIEGGMAAGGPKRGAGWVYVTACFMTSPLSLYFIVKSDRLTLTQKIFASAGALLWAALGGSFLL